MTANPRLSQIRRVTLHYLRSEGAFSYAEQGPSYLLLATEVDRFVQASVRLHSHPGKNPHNGRTTTKIYKITQATLEFKGPFWWTTPDLQNNDDPAGARTIDSYHEQVLWIDEATVKRWRAEELASEYEDSQS